MLVTGREQSRYWYDKISELNLQIRELERGQKTKESTGETSSVVGSGATGASGLADQIETEEAEPADTDFHSVED